MVRVLHVLGTTNLGGAESRIMDLYRHMDRELVQFDFLVHMDPSQYAQAIKDGREPEDYREAGYYDAEINELGGRVYALPRFVGYNLGAYKKAIRRFFYEHAEDYTVVHGHMTSTASIYLPIAKAISMTPEDDNPGDMIIDDELGNTLVTVAHTRNAGVDKGIKGIVTKILRKSLPKKADFLFACSHLAGDETFGGASYTYIPNTVDTERFVFSLDSREEIRDLYDIPYDAIVIGNVARFSQQKNQLYLIEAFWKLLGKAEDAHSDIKMYLMLCGDGSLRGACEARAQELKIADKVIFAGNQSDVQDYYSAMDIFAFPSKYEGLPGVVVEAQASGLKCLISDTITSDVLITDNIETLTIAEDSEKWAQALAEIISNGMQEESKESYDIVSDRQAYADIVKAVGFDVNSQAGKMMRFYLDPCEANVPK